MIPPPHGTSGGSYPPGVQKLYRRTVLLRQQIPDQIKGNGSDSEDEFEPEPELESIRVEYAKGDDDYDDR